VSVLRGLDRLKPWPARFLTGISNLKSASMPGNVSLISTAPVPDRQLFWYHFTSPGIQYQRGASMDFGGRVAMVTGGSGALGGAVVLDLLASGARVAVPYTAEEHWAALRAQAGGTAERLWGAAADLTDAPAVERFAAGVAARWGRIDFLVCIAGGFAAGKIHDTSVENWDRMFDMNLRTAYLAVHAAVPVMIKQNFGRIITTSSGAILNGGGAGIAAYAVSKGAVRQLTEILASELKGYDIHAHCILPGTMDTEANRRAMPKADFSQWVKTEDVARVIHFLLSDEAHAVRAVNVPVLGKG
jgi:NAD(P)-dependent dehydrogenase (short-subunit alcohol dehydrogenase family)